MSTDWLIGQAARLSVAIADFGGGAVDPAALRLKVKTPAGVITTYTYGAGAEIVRDALGAFHADIELAAAGQLGWRWETDAPYAGATEGVLHVRKSLVI